MKILVTVKTLIASFARFPGKSLATFLLLAQRREASLRDADKLEGVDPRIQMQINISPRLVW